MFAILQSYKKIGFVCKKCDINLLMDDEINVFNEFAKIYGSDGRITMDGLTKIVDDIDSALKNNFLVNHVSQN